MKTILSVIVIAIIGAILCSFKAGTPVMQNDPYERDTVNGVYVITGTFWMFTYDHQQVLQPPVLITDGKTETTRSVFTAEAEQECWNQILMLFGQEEFERVKSLNAIPAIPDSLLFPPLIPDSMVAPVIPEFPQIPDSLLNPQGY